MATTTDPQHTVGLFELGMKATVPISCIPASYGHWSFHVGFNFFDFVDNNLYHLNEFNAPEKPKRSMYSGLQRLQRVLLNIQLNPGRPWLPVT